MEGKWNQLVARSPGAADVGRCIADSIAHASSTISLKALSLSRWGGGSSVLGQGGAEFSFGAWLRR
jgi:hypothetical protein